MKSFCFASTFALLGVMLGLSLGQGSGVVDAAASADERVFELRTYYTNDGKLENLHNRFRNHTNTLFVKHGMTLIGYWTPMDGDAAENTLTYLIAHDSRDAAKASWKAFLADPVWKAAYADSIADGKLVAKIDSTFLAATDYSPIR